MSDAAPGSTYPVAALLQSMFGIFHPTLLVTNLAGSDEVMFSCTLAAKAYIHHHERVYLMEIVF